MIPMGKLKDGEWYDGFEWFDGRQKCTATMRWSGSHNAFVGDNLRTLMHRDNHLAGRVYTFEPNVESIGEPAS